MKNMIAMKSQIPEIQNWRWNSCEDQLRWENQFGPLFFQRYWRLISSPVLSQRKWATRKKTDFSPAVEKDRWRPMKTVSGGRCTFWTPGYSSLSSRYQMKGPTGEHRSKGYVPHTYLYIASRVVGVGTGQAVHVTGLASRRWAILTTGRPGKAIPWKRTAVCGRWLAGSQQLWPVPREPPGPPIPRSAGPFFGDRSWSVTMWGFWPICLLPLFRDRASFLFLFQSCD
jgi:hypothetical protein